MIKRVLRHLHTCYGVGSGAKDLSKANQLVTNFQTEDAI